jgi:hypothetical protein
MRLEDHIFALSSFDTVWETFLMYIRGAFLLDSLSRAVGAPALRCPERALKGAATVVLPSDADAVGRGGTPIFSGGDLGKGVGQVRGDGRGGGSARQCHWATSNRFQFVDVIKCVGV